jgi:outer membrane protein assembly factor BamE
MRVRLLPLTALFLAACSTTQLPISPHKIDVQQGNVIDQEVLDKLKPGLTRSQVRFLLGTPLMVDPFRDNRWDYVYVYRTAGRLTAQKRLTLFFDRDVLSRIETTGLDQPAAKTGPSENTGKVESAQTAPTEKPVTGPQPQMPPPAAAAAAESPQPAPDNKPVQEPQLQSKSVAAPEAAAVAQASKPARTKATPKLAKGAASAAAQPRVKTSVVPPLVASSSKSAAQPLKSSSPQSVALQSEIDAATLKPDVMPEFPKTTAVSDVEAPVLAAVKAWAKAWSDRDEEAYLAAYASNFKPLGGFDKVEWEKRRRLLLNLSKNIEVRIESPVVEFPAEGRALITFNQYYRSSAYHDTVVKQVLMGLQDGRWLILEERVLPVLHGKKKK